MAEITGTAGNDMLSGTIGDDVIEGLGGSDTLSGAGGNDTVRGGEGSDTLNGDLGNDRLEGGSGFDQLNGGAGNDQLYGGADGDSFQDESGSDSIYGEGGNDFIYLFRSNGPTSAPAETVFASGGDDNDDFSLTFYNQDSITTDGGSGSDTVTLRALNAAARIGLGADRDVFRLDSTLFLSTTASITFTDFEVGAAGDRIDFDQFLTRTLTNWDQNGNPFATGHLRLVQSGADALLQIDRDGSGTAQGFVTLFTFQNVSAAAITAENLDGYPSDGSVPAGQTFTGTAGNDMLNGTIGDDVIEGLGGFDTLSGAGGNDTIRGGADGDTLYGELGNDRLEGGTGFDTLYGGAGDDQLYGGADSDSFYDESGSDSIYGEAGNDFISLFRSFNGPTPPPAATVFASGGDDNDEFSLSFYNQDSITTDGGSGSDIVTLRGLNAAARIGLGAGRDTFRLDGFFTLSATASITFTDFEAGAAGDRIDFDQFLTRTLTNWDQNGNPFATGHLRLVQSGADTLLQIDRDGSGAAQGFITLFTFQNISAATLTAENLDGYPSDGSIPAGQTFTGTAGNDTLIGTIGDDIIEGLGGFDHLSGGGGNDTIRGGDGGDNLFGELGDDRLEGGAGFDILYGGAGNDQLYGGADSDDLFSEAGSDSLYGEAGNDFLRISSSGPPAAQAAVIFASGGDDNDQIRVSLYNQDSITVDAGSGADTVSFDALSASARIGLGSGRDVFRLERFFNLNSNASIIFTDFETGAAGDRIDFDQFLVQQLTNWDQSSNPFATGHLRLVQSGADTLLQMDRDGSGAASGFVTLFTFQNTNAATLTAENLDGYSPPTATGTDAAETFTGTSGQDLILGGGGDDLFRLEQGGDDVVAGGAGNDAFFLGATLTAADNINGGEGALDQVGLQGNYAGLTFGAGSLVAIEQLVLLPGNDPRFGDTSGALYSYNLTTVDANVAVGQRLVVTANTLRAGENLTFNGSAETDGFFLTYGGLGIDTITGGQKDDGFFFGTGGRFGPGDKVDGQAGNDQLGLQGLYTGANAITFGADQLKSIEFIVALSGGDARFGGNGARYSYDLTTDNGNVAAGRTMVVSANTLRSDETLTFNGSAEADGRFRIFSGAGADVITGGAGNDEINGLGGNDRITGGLGGDKLTGGDGADTFVYAGVAESTSLGFDSLIGFDYRVDRIDLPVEVSGFSGIVDVGKLSSDSFDADLAAATDGALQANSAVIFRPTEGSLAGREFMVIDANGDGVYAAGDDFVFEIGSPAVPINPFSDFFV